MAKKKRKKAAATVAKRKTASAKGKSTKKKVVKKKIGVARKRRKLPTASKPKPVGKTAVAKTPAPAPPGQKPAARPRESLPHKIESAIAAVADIFTDAERLHHKLEPDISNEPE